jgi:transposase
MSDLIFEYLKIRSRGFNISDENINFIIGMINSKQLNDYFIKHKEIIEELLIGNSISKIEKLTGISRKDITLIKKRLFFPDLKIYVKSIDVFPLYVKYVMAPLYSFNFIGDEKRNTIFNIFEKYGNKVHEEICKNKKIFIDLIQNKKVTEMFNEYKSKLIKLNYFYAISKIGKKTNRDKHLNIVNLYNNGKKQHEIAKMMGITRERVRQIVIKNGCLPAKKIKAINREENKKFMPFLKLLELRIEKLNDKEIEDRRKESKEKQMIFVNKLNKLWNEGVLLPNICKMENIKHGSLSWIIGKYRKIGLFKKRRTNYDDIVSSLYKEGFSISEISRKINKDRNVVYGVLRRKGILNLIKFKHDNKIKEMLINGLKVKEIIEKLNVSHNVVYRVIKQYNLKGQNMNNIKIKEIAKEIVKICNKNMDDDGLDKVMFEYYKNHKVDEDLKPAIWITVEDLLYVERINREPVRSIFNQI